MIEMPAVRGAPPLSAGGDEDPDWIGRHLAVRRPQEFPESMFLRNYRFARHRASADPAKNDKIPKPYAVSQSDCRATTALPRDWDRGEAWPGPGRERDVAGQNGRRPSKRAAVDRETKSVLGECISRPG